MFCSVLQCEATVNAVCCSALKCVAVLYGELQCVAEGICKPPNGVTCYIVLHCAVMCCSVLQRVAVCCSALQCVAVCSSVHMCAMK